MEQVLSLFVWSLVLFGVVEGILNFPLLDKLRKALVGKKKYFYLLYFLACKQCFSFWVAVVLSYTYLSPTGSGLVDGFLGTGMYLLLATLTGPTDPFHPPSRRR